MLILVAGCAGTADLASKGDAAVRDLPQGSYQRTGFSCCNLHYDGESISDSNLGQFPFFPAGTPVGIKKIDGHRVFVDINGKAMQMALDHGRQQESAEQWMTKLVVAENPRNKMAAYSPSVRAAIEAGRLMKGMTKEQVVMSVGYPQASDGRRLGTSYWRYWWSGFSPYYVYWKGDKVNKIEGQPETIGNVTFGGK